MLRRRSVEHRLLAALTGSPGRRWHADGLAADAGLRHGTLYTCLADLEARGLVASHWVTVGNGRRREYWLLGATDAARVDLSGADQRRWAGRRPTARLPRVVPA